jgi:hypothetical protein
VTLEDSLDNLVSTERGLMRKLSHDVFNRSSLEFTISYLSYRNDNVVFSFYTTSLNEDEFLLRMFLKLDLGCGGEV